jgi:hypothetical protein
MLRHSVLYRVLQVRRDDIGEGTGALLLIQRNATVAAGFDRPELADSACSIIFRKAAVDAQLGHFLADRCGRVCGRSMCAVSRRGLLSLRPVVEANECILQRLGLDAECGFAGITSSAAASET